MINRMVNKSQNTDDRGLDVKMCLSVATTMEMHRDISPSMLRGVLSVWFTWQWKVLRIIFPGWFFCGFL